MINSFIYDSIPSGRLDACGYFEPKIPFVPLSSQNYIDNISRISLTERTLVVYFPGSFGNFHEGHMSVVRRAYADAKALTDDFAIIISPASSDYSIDKYGDSDFASNKYRYDRIVSYADELKDLNVIIDLNPMLNFEVDHNFTDFLKFFVEQNIGDFERLASTPVIVSGKDRDFSELERQTDKVRFQYYDAQSDIGTSTNFRPSHRPMPELYLRVHTQAELDVFCQYMGGFYGQIRPIFIGNERQEVKRLAAAGDCVTICKDYADIVPYVPLSRHYAHPLSEPSHHACPDLRAQFERYRGYTVIDSDVFSGTTRRFVESMGMAFVSLIDLSSHQNVELLDVDDFKIDRFAYPHVDLSSRCSLPPFRLDEHRLIQKLRTHLKAISRKSN